MEFRLREETADDLEFVRRLFFALRAPDFAPLGLPEAALETLVSQQFAAQAAHFAAQSGPRDHWIVERARDGEPIGRLYIEHQPAQDYLRDIALLPEVQRQGFGGALIDWMKAQAAAKGRGVLLHVDPAREAARRLYLRKGFTEIGIEGADIAMVWRPA